jgi:hypothetical protein
MPAQLITRKLRLSTLISLALVLAAVAGCRSYQLGHPSELPFESIYIRPALNNSFAPQAQTLISSDMREAFIRDGRVKLVTNEVDADVVLLINMTDYERTPGARANDSTRKGFSFDITLNAMVSLYDQNKGRYLFQNELVDASATAYTENPYLPAPNIQTYHIAERQAMPNVSRLMAQKIADRILGVW